MTTAFPPLIPQGGSDNNHEYKHTADCAPNNNGRVDSSRGCTSPLCYLCGLGSSRSCKSPLRCRYALDSSRVAGGREISKCPITGDWGSRSISLEFLKGLRFCWALQDPSVVRIGVKEGERALDGHNHAIVAVRPLLAEKPHDSMRNNGKVKLGPTLDSLTMS